jgi:N-acetylneuraminic acid mutarotase
MQPGAEEVPGVDKLPKTRRNLAAMVLGVAACLARIVEYSVGAASPADFSWEAMNLGDPPDARSAHVAVWTGEEAIYWGGRRMGGVPNSLTNGRIYLPSLNTWRRLGTNGLTEGREQAAWVWTGDSLLVWGGYSISNGAVRFGSTVWRYDAGLDSWFSTGPAGAPLSRQNPTAVWTGTEMFVWGGWRNLGATTNWYATGGRYNPTTGTWVPISTNHALVGRRDHKAYWTGLEMLVWGGFDGTNYLGDGARYNPATDSWTPMSTNGAPEPRDSFGAAWTGSEMLVWGGRNGSGGLGTGYRYRPDLDSWQPMTADNGPEPAVDPLATWTGTELLVWVAAGTNSRNSGRYNPALDTWTTISTNGGPITGWGGVVPVWTGTEWILWGGNGGLGEAGYRYRPDTDSWSLTYRGLSARSKFSSVWTGTEWIIWGGVTNGSSPAAWGDRTRDGARYHPGLDLMIPISDVGAPTRRCLHSAVWTGTEMIVWGGEITDVATTNSGARYDLLTDTWQPMSTSGAPSQRSAPGMVWTGQEVIVWGGNGVGSSAGFSVRSTGAKYDSVTDSWTPVSTNNPPGGRAFHSSHWTGSRMLVWGGQNSLTTFTRTGGLYDPVTDVWTRLTTNGAPSGRSGHAGVFNGSDLIVWGGWNGSNRLADGGRFNLATTNWFPISTNGAPSARLDHTGVWTGTDLIVWGGSDGNETNDGGFYSPATDTWGTVPSNTLGRVKHQAVWTGSAMLVFGGMRGGLKQGSLNSCSSNLYFGDALPNAWQKKVFGANNLNGLPLSDPDGDGLSNEFEYFAGLNPTNAASLWRLDLFPDPAGGDARVLQFSPRYANRLYTIEVSTNNLQPPWTEVMGTTTNNIGFLRNVSIPTNDSNATYRVRISLP